jgi:cytochrome c biogenesis protein CcmG/thiol:disulfide interchange protein DsbE
MRSVAFAALGLALALGCGRSDPAPDGGGPPGPLAGGDTGERFAAPVFALPDLAGGEVKLADLRGRPVVIDFWATWCAPCERQVPVLNAFHEKHGERMPVLGISVDADADAVPAFVKQHDIRYRVLLGDEGLAQDFGAFGYPTLYVVRPDGSIHSAHTGVVSPEALEAAVAEWTGSETGSRH